MSKAPHPRAPARVERLSQAKVRELFPKWPGLEVIRVQGEPATEPTLWQVARAKGAELDRLTSDRIRKDLARHAAERREDAQAKRFWFRGWVATVWAWMRGES